MEDVSDRFLSSIRSSVKRKAVVDVYYGSVSTPIIKDIPIKEGVVTIDRTASIRRTATLTVASPTLDTSKLAPIGTEIVIRSGVVYGDGNEELVSMGTFRIDTLVIDEGTPTEAVLTLVDRSQVMVDDIISPVPVDMSGRTYNDNVAFMIERSFRSLSYKPTVVYDPTLKIGRNLPGGTVSDGGSTWDAIQSLALALVSEAYFDVNGVIQFTTIPLVKEFTSEDECVFTIDVGSNGNMIKGERTVDRTTSYNSVVVIGNTDANNKVVAGTAYDTDKRSVTAWATKFGPKTLVVNNQNLVTQSQCETMARSLLADATSLGRKIDFTCLNNPALAAGDKVLFKFKDGTHQIHVVDQLQIPLNSGEMTGTTHYTQYVV